MSERASVARVERPKSSRTLVEMEAPMDLSRLEADFIFARLAELLGCERNAQAEFLLHLAEVDRRRLFAKTGHGSLWDFCVRKLGLQKSATYQRVTAVAILNRYPAAIDYLRDGRVTMSALVLLRNVLERDNARDWLERISHESCEDVEAMVGEPRPERRDAIRKLPAVVTNDRVASAEPVVDLFASAAATQTAAVADVPCDSTVAPDPRPLVPAPLPEDQYRLTLTVGPRFKKLLDEAAALASHKIPRKDPGAVLLLALGDLVVKLRKQRGLGRVPKRGRRPRADSPVSTSQVALAPVAEPAAAQPSAERERDRAKRRRVPAEVYRQVWARDQGRCAWVMPDGRRCGETWQLEIDHVPPIAKGGTSTVEGCRLACRGHNLQGARNEFGDELMDRFLRPEGSGSDIRKRR